MRAHIVRLGAINAAGLDAQVRSAMDYGLPIPVDQLSIAHWSSTEGTVQVWSVSNEGTDELGESLAPGGWCVRTGYARGDFGAVAASLVNGGDELDTLGGIWSLMGVRESTVAAATSRAGVDPVFETTAADGALWLGTRPAWLHLAATGLTKPDLDVVGLTGLVCTGSAATDRTTYTGVRHLGAGQIVRARLEGDRVVVVHTSRTRPDRADRPDPKALAEALSLAVSDLPVPDDGYIRLGITGGRDSRLMAAAILNAGYRVRMRTHGLEGSGDVVAGRMLSGYLGVEHTRVDKAGVRLTAPGSGRISINPSQRLMYAVVLSDGAYSAYDAAGGAGTTYRADNAALSGSGGEVLRGGYAKAHDPAHNKDGVAWLLAGHVLSGREVIDQDVWKAYELDVGEWAEACRLDPHEALFDYYLRQRTARWMSGSRLATSLAANARIVFLDDAVIWNALAAPMSSLLDESLVAGAMDELYPGLSKVPFLGRRLECDAEPPADTPQFEQWLARRPIPDGPSEANYNWRTDYPQGVAEIVREGIGHDRTGLFTADAADRMAPLGVKVRTSKAVRGWHAATAGQLSNPIWWNPTTRFEKVIDTAEFALPVPAAPATVGDRADGRTRRASGTTQGAGARRRSQVVRTIRDNLPKCARPAARKVYRAVQGWMPREAVPRSGGRHPHVSRGRRNHRGV